MSYYVIYDGTCNLCVTFVQGLEMIDQGQQFRYIPMQDEQALSQFEITAQDCEQGMMLLDADDPQRRWQGTAAAEEIGNLLPVANLLVAAYRGVPGLKWSGDRIYAQVRDNRYTLFGKRDRIYQSQYPACESGTCG